MVKPDRKFTVEIVGQFSDKVDEAAIHNAIKFSLWQVSIPGRNPEVNVKEVTDGNSGSQKPA